MKVVAIVGMSGSGKSEVTASLVKWGFTSIRFGDLTDREISRRGLELNEKNERYIREQLRKEHGMAAYAKLNLAEIKFASCASPVVIDGLYSWDEYKVIKGEFGNSLVIIAVFSSPEARYKRLSERQIRPLLSEEAMSRDFAEIENLAKGGPIAMADYTIVNESSIEDLRRQLQIIVSAIS